MLPVTSGDLAKWTFCGPRQTKSLERLCTVPFILLLLGTITGNNESMIFFQIPQKEEGW